MKIIDLNGVYISRYIVWVLRKPRKMNYNFLKAPTEA